MNYKPITILLVEDNPGDIRLTKENLKQGKVLNNLMVAEDGQTALDILYKRDPYVEAETPDLILLDLTLPEISGQEVLQIIKNDDTLKTIPVVILSASTDQKDIDAAYANYASCFISKPVDVNNFINVINSIEDFWITLARYP